MVAACFSMDLYCDLNSEFHGWNEFPHQFTGETFGECRRQAVERGWTFKRDGTHQCPKCFKKRTKVKSPRMCECGHDEHAHFLEGLCVIRECECKSAKYPI